MKIIEYTNYLLFTRFISSFNFISNCQTSDLNALKRASGFMLPKIPGSSLPFAKSTGNGVHDVILRFHKSQLGYANA